MKVFCNLRHLCKRKVSCAHYRVHERNNDCNETDCHYLEDIFGIEEYNKKYAGRLECVPEFIRILKATIKKAEKH